MSQGYRLTLTIASIPVQFQSVDVAVDGDDLDSSSSINPDGTYNGASGNALADIEPDLIVATVSINTVIKDVRVLTLMGTFLPKRKYDVVWGATYGSRSYSGRGIYIMHHHIGGRIPGDARLQMTFRSIQGYSATPLTAGGTAGYVLIA